MSSPVAPVIVFAYKRPEHLRRTIESLRANPQACDSDLVICCDGAKGPADAQAVAAVRAYARSVEGFASLTVQARTENLGLAESIITGVTEMLTRHTKVIVLEDDLLLSRQFLAYMNEALTLYEGDERVASIHGYSYPTRDPLPETFFLLGADCWGWATWRRAWRHFNPNGAMLLEQLRERRLTHRFDFDGAYPYTRMLEDQVRRRNDSWAIRWHASCFLDDMLTLYPGRSLVHNIGNDSSGTHAGTTARFDQVASDRPVNVARLPLVESAVGRAAFVDFFRGQRAPPIQRLARHLRSLWKRPL